MRNKLLLLPFLLLFGCTDEGEYQRMKKAKERGVDSSTTNYLDTNLNIIGTSTYYLGSSRVTVDTVWRTKIVYRDTCLTNYIEKVDVLNQY